jgi:hypothetical protein
MKRSPGLWLLLWASLVSCADPDGVATETQSPAIADACNPLGGLSCLLPWPSSVYLDADPRTATGLRVSVPALAMPVNSDGVAIDPAPLARHDGFSSGGLLVVAFPNGVSEADLPGHRDVAASVADSSPIVLLDMSTGARQPFFAEIDHNPYLPKDRALIIRPLRRLAEKTRFAVAIRNTLRDVDGAPLPRPAAFQALLDGKSMDHPRFSKLSLQAGAIFASLEKAGVRRDELVLAWDFVVASDEFLTRDLLTMRDRAVPMMGEKGKNLTFEAAIVNEGNPRRVWRYLEGTFDSPAFLTDGEEDTSVLVRDQNDGPIPMGMYRTSFAAVIPACAKDPTQWPLPIILFGHGLFDSASNSMRGGFLHDAAEENCAVFLGSDWIGLANRQIDLAALSMSNLNRGYQVADKLAQGVINMIALEHLARGPLAESPLFQVEQGKVLLDTSDVTYYGASLGGIMGGVFMAYDPFVKRGVLGVPGSNWSLLLQRSTAFTILQAVLESSYTEPLWSQVLISLMGHAFDPYDPITTTTRVLSRPLPGTPEKQLFLYEGVGDSLVSNLTTEMTARSLGIPVTGPSVRVPFGLTVTTIPVTSALTIYDEQPDPAPPDDNVPPSKDNGTHVDVNKRAAVQRQVRHFLKTGQVIHECRLGDVAVACDCQTGACD